MWDRLKRWAQQIKRDLIAIYFAARDPKTPFWIKALALAVVAYAISPIDLIPDFIPVLGYLDDLIVLPLGIWWVLRALPTEVFAAARALASAQSGFRITSKTAWIAAAVIVLLWILLGLIIWQSLR
jgi:uncharacterized membrane protein YkvA (DUF1232 family)